MSMELGLEGKSAVMTGAGGALCGSVACSLAKEGVQLSIWDISLDRAEETASQINSSGGTAIAVRCDVTDPYHVEKATIDTINSFSTIDILVNGAGGSLKEATTSDTLSFFDIENDAMHEGFGLNYLGTVIPCQHVGRVFAEKGEGVILNISSIAGIRPLSRAVSYSDAKASVNSFTQWLAVHMAENYSNRIRVNAIAPGFILTDQNRFLLVDEEGGGFSERGNCIIKAVPMSRLGKPDEIIGAALWLISSQASFVTGAIIPIDGGFTADCGV